jgi:hypothetical protein
VNRVDDDEMCNHRLYIIDLHGVTVKFACDLLTAICDYFNEKVQSGIIYKISVQFIAGRGSHSIHGISKLTPVLIKKINHLNHTYAAHEGSITIRLK